MKAIIIQDDEIKSYSRDYFRYIMRMLMIESYEVGMNNRYLNKESLIDHCNERIEAVFNMTEN